MSLPTCASTEKFWDALCTRCDIETPCLPVDCDGCNAKNLIAHALGCKKGGIVTLRHDGIANTLAQLGAQAFKPSAMRDEPHIRSRAATPREVKAIAESMKANKNAKNKTPPLHDSDIFTADRGDVAIAGPWHSHTDCIIDARVTDTDQESYLKQDPAKVLSNQERSKKAKCLEPCLAQRRHFSPFVASVDGMFGREATTVAKRLAAVLASKWQRPYSVVCSYVKSRLAIDVIRSTNRCMRGSRTPSSGVKFRIIPEDGSAIIPSDW